MATAVVVKVAVHEPEAIAVVADNVGAALAAMVCGVWSESNVAGDGGVGGSAAMGAMGVDNCAGMRAEAQVDCFEPPETRPTIESLLPCFWLTSSSISASAAAR